jgi:DNA-binding HxlR family transcriptional regulator
VAGQQVQPGKAAYEHVAAWPLVMRRLALARRQWDVAILVNLRHCGLGPAELLRRINDQAAEWEADRRLTWKVLAERLDWLEDARYLTRREIGRQTLYWLRPEACRTLAALDAFEAWCDEQEHEVLSA